MIKFFNLMLCVPMCMLGTFAACAEAFYLIYKHGGVDETQEYLDKELLKERQKNWELRQRIKND